MSVQGRSEVAGTLRERVRQELPGPRDAAGAPGAVQEGRAAWAEVRPERPVVVTLGDGLGRRERFTLRMRRGSGFQVGDRLRWRDRRLEVVARVEDPRTPGLLLLTAEVRP